MAWLTPQYITQTTLTGRSPQQHTSRSSMSITDVYRKLSLFHTGSQAPLVLLTENRTAEKQKLQIEVRLFLVQYVCFLEKT